MNCGCGQNAISERGLCEKHFCEWIEQKVKETIGKYEMIRKRERVLVAASGGKDSLTLLKIIKQLDYDVSALCIDEGIAGYREKTIVDLKRVCTENNIPLIIKTFKQEKGATLDELKPKHPCTTCGVYRRELMASAAKDFDVIATGHNMDDEAQAVLMNIFKHHAMKPQPVLVANKLFTRRVKPLYFITEADVKRYAFIHNLVTEFVECVHASSSHRRLVHQFLERREMEHPGSKETLLKNYLATVQSS